MYPVSDMWKKNYLESYLPSSHFMGLHFILNSERTVLKFCAFVVLSSFPCIFIGFALCLYISSFIIHVKRFMTSLWSLYWFIGIKNPLVTFNAFFLIQFCHICFLFICIWCLVDFYVLLSSINLCHLALGFSCFRCFFYEQDF